MPDLDKLSENKQKIISVIENQGPSFPTRISQEVGISPLFVSAFLAELVSDKRLKISNMKVGSSPIYHLPGQEDKLEEFTNYLNPREREAFELIKTEKVIEDSEQPPAIRVALRSIKDFAIPVNARVDGEPKLFWKYYSIQDNEIKEILEKKSNPKSETKSEVKEIEKPTETPIQETKKPTEPKKEVQDEKPETKEKTESETKSKPKTKNTKKSEPSKFEENIKDYLKGKDIEILESITSKKKEFVSKVRTDELFGKQEYYLIAKDKKKVSTDDFLIALQKAQTEKMPALVMSPGEPDKKAKEYLKEWKNMVKFEKVNF